jgi:starvation-inducible DNA-binding protein
MKSTKMFETSHDLDQPTRERVIMVLNQQLADTVDLFSQVKQAHWNIKGMNFIALHELFDQFAAELLTFSDILAERVTALGGLARGTVRMSGEVSTLPEANPETVAGDQVVVSLTTLFACYAKSTRKAIDVSAQEGDQGTADLFTEISRAIDKDLWFLEAHSR